MAKPIEPTPVLKGKDAEVFFESISTAKFSKEKESLFKKADEAYRKYMRE